MRAICRFFVNIGIFVLGWMILGGIAAIVMCVINLKDGYYDLPTFIVFLLMSIAVIAVSALLGQPLLKLRDKLRGRR